MELFWAIFLAAVALLFDYLGLTYGHAWLAWGAAVLGWFAVVVWTGRRGGKHRNAARILWGVVLVLGTAILLNASPKISETLKREPLRSGNDTLSTSPSHVVADTLLPRGPRRVSRRMETHALKRPRFGESGEYTIIFGNNAIPLTPNVPVDLFGVGNSVIYIDGFENTKVGATLVNGEVLITAKLYAGMMGPVEVVNNKLVHTNPLWDRNYDSTAFEVVNEKLEPRLQVIQATPHSWKVYGVFVSGKGGFIAGPGHGLEFMAVFPESLRLEHKLPRLFRYPSRKYQGVELGDSLRGS